MMLRARTHHTRGGCEKYAPQVQHYNTFEDDFVQSANQQATLPNDYVWIDEKHPTPTAKNTVFYALMLAFGQLYCRVGLHAHIENRALVRHASSGCFVFANHTQPMGDAFITGVIAGMRRPYVVISPANLGIPVLGKKLPALGGLPIPSSLGGLKRFSLAVGTRIAQGHPVFIYPEAHVWPWCTWIRPLPETSFGFPVQLGAPSFCMTTTYQPRRIGRKPKITVYLDGPFYPDTTLSKRMQRKDLRDRIEACMRERSKLSTCDYVVYEPAPGAPARPAPARSAESAQVNAQAKTEVLGAIA